MLKYYWGSQEINAHSTENTNIHSRMKTLFNIIILIVCIISVSTADVLSPPIEDSTANVYNQTNSTNEIAEIILCVYENATERLQKEAERYKERAMKEESNGYLFSAASNYIYAANAYNQTNSTNETIEMLEKAALLYEQEARGSSSLSQSSAVEYFKDAADTYMRAGNIAKHDEMLQELEFIYEQQVIHFQTKKQYSNLAIHSRYVADYYKERSDHEQANELIKKFALESEQYAIKSETKKNHDLALMYYIDAANAYNELGNKDKAIEMFTKISAYAMLNIPTRNLQDAKEL